MKYKIKENDNDNNKKNIKVIKFDNKNDDINIKYLIEICQNYLINNINNLYFIFIFDIKDEKDSKKEKKKLSFKKYIEDKFKEIEKKSNIKINIKTGIDVDFILCRIK